MGGGEGVGLFCLNAFEQPGKRRSAAKEVRVGAGGEGRLSGECRVNGDEGSWWSPEEHPGPGWAETPRAWSSCRRVTGKGAVREGGGLTLGLGHRELLIDLVRAVPCYGGNRGQRA